MDRLIIGTGGTPTAPLEIGEGALGELEGTAVNKPGIGDGDGVMIAGDVRSLARVPPKGDKVQYEQFRLGHVTTAAPWIASAMTWLWSRFAGVPAPSNCARIEPGNSLAPIAE